MKKAFSLWGFLFLAFTVLGQDSDTRPSPAAQAMAVIAGKTISINYGQPSVKGREIFGKLVPFGQVWRAGANETTAITLSDDARVEGRNLPAGKYAFFVIPNEKEWTLIFNSTIKWGAFSYKPEEDVLRISVPTRKGSFTEKLSYNVDQNGTVVLAWANTAVSFKVEFPTPVISEVSIAMSPEKWQFSASQVEFLEYKGQKAMKLLDRSATVVLKDLQFKNGTIEYDVEAIDPNFTGIYFRMQSKQESEYFYLRVARAGNPNINDAIQYAPYVKGNLCWNLYNEYQSHAAIKANDWNHIKIVVHGKQMKVYVNDQNTPSLEVPYLESNVAMGQIAFEGSSYLANLVVKHNAVENLAAQAGPDLSVHDAYYLREWLHTDTFSLSPGKELTTLNLPKAEQFTQGISAERKGLINLSRKFGVEKKRTCIWLKVKLNSREDQKKLLHLGFLDEVWVFVNKRMVYVDKQLYGQGMRKNPDGRISILNSSFNLPLQKGENEILIGLSNFFYGWGIIARLEDMDGILELNN
jgi:Protein of unknown function (DUF2911)/Domain of Unknown Function (DUF1080)